MIAEKTWDLLNRVQDRHYSWTGTVQESRLRQVGTKQFTA